MGWKGIWVGGNDLAVNIKNNNKLRFYKNWITSDNIIEIIKRGLGDFEKENFDLISVDLDGNDYYIVKTILELKIFPSVFILEYNAKFPPPIDFKSITTKIINGEMMIILDVHWLHGMNYLIALGIN